MAKGEQLGAVRRARGQLQAVGHDGYYPQV